MTKAEVRMPKAIDQQQGLDHCRAGRHGDHALVAGVGSDQGEQPEADGSQQGCNEGNLAEFNCHCSVSTCPAFSSASATSGGM